MFSTSSLRFLAAAFLALLALSFATVPSAFAEKKVVVGPVSFDVPDDFKDVPADKEAPGSLPAIHEDTSGITIQVSELPLEALHEFKGPAFLQFLQSLGYTNPTYADGALKRTDAYTYVLADAKGTKGAESRFLLVIGGNGRAAIVTAYAPKSEIDSGHASRAGIEAILAAASVVPGDAPKP